MKSRNIYFVIIGFWVFALINYGCNGGSSDKDGGKDGSVEEKQDAAQEDGINGNDGSDLTPDASDGSTDLSKEEDNCPQMLTQYPPDPYGTELFTTIDNFSLEECICTGNQPEGRPIELADFLGNTATLISVHTGWCPACKDQADKMEDWIYQAYKDQGFGLLLFTFQDDQLPEPSTTREDLLDFCCRYKELYKFSFSVAIDPGAEVFLNYANATPLNMVLDDEMQIRFKVAGYLSDTLGDTIQRLIWESEEKHCKREPQFENNTAIASFDLKMNVNPFLNEKVSLEGKYDNKFLFISLGGYVVHNQQDNEYDMELLGLLSNNIFQTVRFFIPDSCPTDETIRFGEEIKRPCENENDCEYPETCGNDGYCGFGVYCGATGFLYLVTIDNNDERHNNVIAEISNGRLTFGSFGSNTEDQVKGNMVLEFKAR